MSAAEVRALRNAAASSAMEGLPLNQEHVDTIQEILDGQQTLQDFFRVLKERYQEA